jgi:LCP family protein required for cell wall assembly
VPADPSDQQLTGYLPPAVATPPTGHVAGETYPAAPSYSAPYAAREGYATAPATGYAPSNGYAPANGYANQSQLAPGIYTPDHEPLTESTDPNGYQPPAGPAPSGDVRSIDMNPRQPTSGGPMRGRHATQWNQGFGRVVGWTLLGSLIPGTGLIAAGRRVIGWAVFGLCVLAVLAGMGVLIVGDPVATISHQFLAHPERLTYAAAGIALLGVLWAVHVIATHASLRGFAELTGWQRSLSLALVSTLVLGGVGGALYSSKQVLLGRDTLNAIFSGEAPLSTKSKRPNTTGAVADPWANTPRINVLLIGSDAGADRTGLRTDSLILASIDTKTGETVLFSIPRNLEHVPFPAGTQQSVDFPEGFACPEHACLINALWQFGVEHKDMYYKGDKNPGLTATVQGVQETLGLTVDNYAMVDLRGFMQFVDAIGGVTINVTRRIPVGGHRDPATGIATGVTSYIKPGRQLLDGYKTLWFARSRSDSDDFERMRRQRCVIGAVTQQSDPQTIAMHLPAIMQAAKNNIRTSIPVSDIDAWVTLTMRVKKAHVRSLPFTNAVINSGDPDFTKIHALVQNALLAPVTTATPTPSASVSPSPSATGRHTTRKTTTVNEDPNAAVDVKAVC